jgi:TolB protein
VLLFSSARGGVQQLYRMDLGGGDLLQLTREPGDNAWAAWSPDGSRIAFVSTRDRNPEIYVMNADGSDQRRLSRHPGLDMDPVWSPAGDRIAYTSQDDRGHGRIIVVHPDGSGPRPVTDGTLGDELNAAWSPDGRVLAFTVRKGSGAEVWTAPTAGGAPKKLTDTAKAAAEFPVWSPDGRRLAYLVRTRSTSEIWTMNADGTDRKALTKSLLGRNIAPSWSPDGRRILFASDRVDGNRMNVYVMDADGAGVRNVSNSPHEDTHPAWSADGRDILFTRMQGGNTRIFRVAADGGEPAVVTANGRYDEWPRPRPATASTRVAGARSGQHAGY